VTQENTMNEFISIAEIAAEMGRSKGTIRRWLRKGQLRGSKHAMTDRWIVRREDVAQDLRDK
jgi:excisionase family DNA binding protein